MRVALAIVLVLGSLRVDSMQILGCRWVTPEAPTATERSGARCVHKMKLSMVPAGFAICWRACMPGLSVSSARNTMSLTTYPSRCTAACTHDMCIEQSLEHWQRHVRLHPGIDRHPPRPAAVDPLDALPAPATVYPLVALSALANMDFRLSARNPSGRKLHAPNFLLHFTLQFDQRRERSCAITQGPWHRLHLPRVHRFRWQNTVNACTVTENSEEQDLHRPPYPQRNGCLVWFEHYSEERKEGPPWPR